jgi:large subunit ribosomal protein L41
MGLLVFLVHVKRKSNLFHKNLPDLTDCKLRPYVSYKTKDIYQEPLTSRDLFNVIYGHKMLKDFKEGKLDTEGQPSEPSEEEKLTPEEAWYYLMKFSVLTYKFLNSYILLL